MIHDDADLERLREAFAAPAGPPPNPDACPSPERIWAAARGELSASEVREVIDHTIACAACAEDWRLAAALDREARAADGVAETRTASSLRSPFGRPWLSAVAAIFVLGIVVVIPGLRKDDPAPIYRGEDGAIQPLLAPGEALPREGAVLRWAGPPGAVYDVQVTTEDLHVIAKAGGLETSELRIPADALRDLPAGATLLWRVEATLPDGTELASETFSNPLR